MSKLLLDEAPLQVQSCLATAIGLNEAIALQQLHWVLQNPRMGKDVDGKRYVHMSYAEWRIGHFPFWSEPTIQRTFSELENTGLVESRDDLNQLSFDRTKWYTINHVRVAEVEQSFTENKRVIEHIKMKDAHIKMKDASHQNERTIPESSFPDSSAEAVPPPQKSAPPKEEPAAPTQRPQIFVLYEQNIGLLTPMLAEELKDAERDYPAEWFADAFREAVTNNVRKWKYVRAILERWKTQGRGDLPQKDTDDAEQKRIADERLRLDELERETLRLVSARTNGGGLAGP